MIRTKMLYRVYLIMTIIIKTIINKNNIEEIKFCR